CPTFRGRQGCSHLWAAILEADREHLVTDADEARFLKLSTDHSPSREVLTSYSARQVPVVPPPPQLSPWREHLFAIRGAQEQVRPDPPTWPHGMEILYVIDVPSSRAAGALVIDL